MPRVMKVLNGPGFKHLAFSTGVLSEYDFSSTFKMNDTLPEFVVSSDSDRSKFSLSVLSIGRMRRTDEDQFFLLATLHGVCKRGVPGRSLEEWGHWYYVIHYNTKTRRGECTEFPEKEFFASTVTRVMFNRPKAD